MTASLAGRDHCRSLSSYTPSGTDFAACRATLVSLATCSAFVAAEDARKFPREDVWEAPLCTVANVGSLIRASTDEWHYMGCSTCFRKACDQHAQDSQRACYSLELAVWDHTAAVDMKMFTRCVGAALAVQPGAPVQSVEAAMREVRQRKWRLRFTVAYKEAYSGNADTRRPARNNLQVVHVQEQPSSFAGSPKPLVCIGADNFLPGCPHLQLSDVALDDAGQAQTTGGLRLQCAECLMRATDAEPEQRSHELERGVRITFTCVDALDESSRARLMWVLSTKESLPVARPRPGTLLRVIARPCILHWQVLFHFPSSQEDAQAFAKRRLWQLEIPGADLCGVLREARRKKRSEPVARDVTTLHR